jgi:glyoxylate/hydroxypyruvate reductase A
VAIILVSDYNADAALWERELSWHIGEIDFRVWPDIGDPGDIDVVLIDTLMGPKGGFGQFPHLRWVSYLGHGVGDVLRDPSLAAGVVVTRLKDPLIACGLAEYVIHAVTAHHLKAGAYAKQQGDALWRRLDVPPARAQHVAVLGLGVIGLQTATSLRTLGFQVFGWSQSHKEIAGMECLHGRAALEPLLARSDYVVAALPETDSTTGLFDRNVITAMKPGAYVINIGRGSLIVEEDLLDALDAGHLSGASLDVFRSEPLPADSSLWRHPKVTITPHTGGAGSDAGYILEIAENYRRFLAGEPLRNLANRLRGY